jgi:NAD(P)-dependent dehydrogenase (short-subunit alcohol dehydrogenase family)
MVSTHTASEGNAQRHAKRRRILLTGVSAGLGRALARVLVDGGAQVLGTARRAELGTALVKELNSNDFRFLAADISKVGDCERAVAACVQEFGGIDVLINNAGARTAPPITPLTEVDEANWDNVCDTNLKGPFFLSRYALEHMRAAGSGLIINISSQTAEHATAGMAAYAATKAGLAGLTRAIAVEYLDQGIRANTILLGGTATGQESRTMNTDVDAKTASRRSGATSRFEPMLYTSEQVARVISMLTTEDAAPITGASIALDHAATAGSLSSAYIHEVIAGAARR